MEDNDNNEEHQLVVGNPILDLEVYTNSYVGLAPLYRLIFCVNNLYTKIRNRALIQYFSSYLSADMRKMATAFNRNVEALEIEVMQLILDGQIQARIDSHNKILYAKETDQRSSTFEQAISMVKKYQRRSRMLVLRAAILKSNIHVKSIPGESGNHVTDLCVAAGSSTSTTARI